MGGSGFFSDPLHFEVVDIKSAHECVYTHLRKFTLFVHGTFPQ